MSADLERRVADLERRIEGLVRVGRVSSASSGAGTARVVFDDTESGEAVTHDLPVLYPRTKGALDHWTLSTDEQVVCVFLPLAGGQEQGFVLGAHYSEIEPPPSSDANLRVLAGGEVRMGSHAASHVYVFGDALKTLFDAHVHPTPMGPSGPPIALHRVQLVGAPGYPHLSEKLKGE